MPAKGAAGRKSRPRPSDHSGGGLIGAQGRPLRDYRGWDEAAGVFRMDDPAAQPWFVQQARARAGGAAPPDEGVPLPPEVAALFGLPADAASESADAASAPAQRNGDGRRRGRGAD